MSGRLRGRKDRKKFAKDDKKKKYKELIKKHSATENNAKTATTPATGVDRGEDPKQLPVDANEIYSTISSMVASILDNDDYIEQSKRFVVGSIPHAMVDVWDMYQHMFFYISQIAMEKAAKEKKPVERWYELYKITALEQGDDMIIVVGD